MDRNHAPAALLELRRAERDALLEQDPRVVAAWLFGSLGLGAGDALSELDLFVVIADEHLEAVIEARDAFIAQLGTPVQVLEAPQNAPPRGAYAMALYSGEDGPH